ncbi:MAG: phosphoribosylglycinamide formyltransferase [Candidatus Brocadiia bacterium]|nr:MAG: phosphoribosylglycinamide formyltransferase [Candidatus Brocadiia bacterium]
MQEQNNNVIIYTDGGSRGNPGPAAAGFTITDTKGNLLCARGIFIGRATNNEAEYTAIVKGLEAAKECGAKSVTVLSDSELMVRQLNGEYKVKSDLLRPLFLQASDLLDSFKSRKVSHITRDKNKQADKLVNDALDRKKDVEASPKVKNKPSGAASRPIRLGVLISGGGTTMINISEHIKQGKLNAEISIVISSRSETAGVDRAKEAGLTVEVIRKKDYPDIMDFSKKIEEALAGSNVDLVIQAGWLCLWNIPAIYENRVMNIHPALLPSFGGQGMWGHHVHEAAIKTGVKITGCTVHFCTNEYDKGPIIIQRCCPVKEYDTPDTLGARVFEQECIAYPEAINLFAQGRITVEGSRTRIK